MRERAQAMMADKDAQIAAVKVLQPCVLPICRTRLLPAACQLPRAGNTCSATTSVMHAVGMWIPFTVPSWSVLLADYTG